MPAPAVSRKAARRLVGAALVAGLVGGCTFLVSFDDAPAAEDAAPPPPGDGAVADATAADAGAADAPRDVNVFEASSCVGKTNGLYCGNNQITDYPGSKDDLVTCDGGKIAAVKPCLTGVGCIHMPNPRPDQCDECARKDAGGYYCGRDMPGWAPDNDDVRVRCMAGSTVDTTGCTQCTSNGNNSTCP